VRQLNAEVETCRQTHVGHVLRQQIKVECCPIVEYRYQFARKEYSILPIQARFWLKIFPADPDASKKWMRWLKGF